MPSNNGLECEWSLKMAAYVVCPSTLHTMIP